MSKISTINDIVFSLCEEIGDAHFGDWKHLTEMELLREAITCICSSQVKFEEAEAAADRVMEKLPKIEGKYSTFCPGLLSGVLDKPIDTPGGCNVKKIHFRFKNQTVRRIEKTLETFKNQNVSFTKILSYAKNSKSSRLQLTKLVTGFGPKQASMFLRRVGYASDLAIIDTHIADYLELKQGKQITRSALPRLSYYEQVEKDFIMIADYFGEQVGKYDLAVWLTMRKAKRLWL